MEAGNIAEEGLGVRGTGLTVKSCSLCWPTGPETQAILAALLQKFTLTKNEGSSRGLRESERYDLIGFRTLVNTTFAKKYNNFKPTALCPHDSLKTYSV